MKSLEFYEPAGRTIGFFMRLLIGDIDDQVKPQPTRTGKGRWKKPQEKDENEEAESEEYEDDDGSEESKN